MIRIKFFDTTLACVYESPVFTAQWSRTLSKSGEWTATLPLTSQLYDLISQTLTAEIWDGKTYCIGGKVQKNPNKYDQDPTIEIKGREEIDALYDHPANSALYINNKSFLLQLFTLLDLSGWRLGLYEDIDNSKLITLDLRRVAPRLAQLSALLKIVPGLYYRFGGFDVDGQPLLDVSLFDRNPVHQIFPSLPGSQTRSVVVGDVASLDDYTTRIYGLEAVGGDVQISSTVKRTILLSDLLNFATLSLDLNYPIYEEMAELVYVVVPTAEGPIGGTVDSVPTTLVNGIYVGDVVATNNYWGAFIFHAYPGQLTEISVWTGPISASIEANKLTNPLLWEIREVDESNVQLTTGTIVGSGTVDPALWTANSRLRQTFDGSISLSGTKRYMYRLGLTSQPAAAATMQFKVGSTNRAKSFRSDRAGSYASNNGNINNQPLMRVVTAASVPAIGRRDFAEEKKFAPQKEGADATTTDIQNAALALYEWTTLRLAAFSQNRRDLTVTPVGYDASWKPGDAVRVLAQLQFIERNRSEWETRVVEQLTYSAADQTIKMATKFLPNIADDEPDSDTISLYDEQKAKETPPEGKIIEPFFAWERNELSYIIEYTVPDTTLLDGTPAVTVAFNLATPPTGKGESRLMGTPYGIHANTAIQIVVEVTAKSETQVTCRVAKLKAGWGLYDYAIIYCDQVWR